MAEGASWTIGRVINWSAGYLREHGAESPRLDAELLLARALGVGRLDLYLRFDQPLAAVELAAFKVLLKRRRSREPVAYILGEKEFWGLPLKVGPGVLVPRPETEHLVEEGLKALADAAAPRILDLCTGSGAVLLALLRAREDASGVGVDLAPAALDYAKANAARHGLAERSQWLAGDLFAPVAAAGGFFDLVTANPPYVRAAEWAGLAPEVREFEPREALLAGEDGLSVIRSLVAGAPAHLRAGGTLLVELGAGQAGAALALARAARAYERIELVKDLAGVERVLRAARGDYG